MDNVPIPAPPVECVEVIDDPTEIEVDSPIAPPVPLPRCERCGRPGAWAMFSPDGRQVCTRCRHGMPAA